MNKDNVEFLAVAECFGGGSIAIYQSEGGLPVIFVHDRITHDMAHVEVKDTAGAKRLINALNECAGEST